MPSRWGNVTHLLLTFAFLLDLGGTSVLTVWILIKGGRGIDQSLWKKDGYVGMFFKVSG